MTRTLPVPRRTGRRSRLACSGGRRRALCARDRVRSPDADASRRAPAPAGWCGAALGGEGVPVQMVFIGTCTGGRAVDFRDACDAFARGGGRIAPGVQLVLTPASREVHDRLRRMARSIALSVPAPSSRPPGCGACCGTSGVIPGDGMTVLSTANRNFKARMGNATAQIYLASPAVCGLAAATGRIPLALLAEAAP